jgi:hypothetical protein
MVVIMIWRPRGLVATRTPSIFMGKHHDVDAEFVRRARAKTWSKRQQHNA